MTTGDASADGSNRWNISFSAGDQTRGQVEAEVISAIEYDRSGEFLATGNKGGRVTIYNRNGPYRLDSISSSTRPQQQMVYTEFQSHKAEFDYLKSLEIEEKINQIKWCRPSNNAQYLLSTNDKTIKLWKIHERRVREVTQYNSPHQDDSLRTAPPQPGPEAVSSYPVDLMSSIRLPQTAVRDRITTSTAKRVYANAHTYHINSIALNSDGETFMSADDLRVYHWNLGVSNQTFSALIIVDGLYS
jgi:serine/threonine-protein phosphatase 2A regulatory subunit B